MTTVSRKRNSGMFKKGHKKIGGFDKGDKHSEETIKIIKESMTGRTGNKSNAWKGGKTAIRKLIPSLLIYIDWRDKVFKRDGWTCQDCGARGCYLEAHHIKSLADLIDEYNLTTREEIEACEELWEVSNGRTLCLDCHNKIPKKRRNKYAL